jgi:DNA-binding NarL/FixJ family response regulator
MSAMCIEVIVSVWNIWLIRFRPNLRNCQRHPEAARILRRELPQVKVLIMSHHDPNYLLSFVIEAGVRGYVDKSRLDSDLAATIGNIEQTRI